MRALRALAAAAAAAALVAGCGGPNFFVELHGEPPEVRKLILEEDYDLDARPASVRTAEAFFAAVDDEDGERVWALLDLRAAAAWQRQQRELGRAEPSAFNIVDLVRPALPAGASVESRTSFDRRAGSAVVALKTSSPEGRKALTLTMSSEGWRVVLPPQGVSLAALDLSARPTDTAAPIDWDRERDRENPDPAPAREPGSDPFGGKRGLGGSY